jgi:flagellar hook-associated protein 2
MNVPSAVNTTTSTSTNSAANIYAQVNSIMQSQNKVAPALNAALNVDTTTLSGLGQLQSALASFQAVAQSLSGKGVNLSATSSAPGVVSATTSSQSVAGSYSIQVTQLAQSQLLQSKIQASQDGVIGQGAASKITFDFGAATGSAFKTSASGKSIILPAGTNSLQSIASAINGANMGVVANVIPSGKGFALSIQSPSGAASSLRITVNGDQGLKDLLSYNPAGVKNLSQSVAAQNALATVNGVAVSSATNTLSHSVPGTTLNLAATGTSTLVIAQGSAQISQNVTGLVNAYNVLNSQLNTLKQGTLKSDGSALRTQNLMASIFVSSGAGGASNSTSQALIKMGISTQKDGVMAIDANKLKTAISADPASVAKIFTNGVNGIADQLSNQIQGLIGPNGSFAKKATTINLDIAALNAKKASLQTVLNAQANALVGYYSQGTSGSTSTSSTTGGGNSLLNYLR